MTIYFSQNTITTEHVDLIEGLIGQLMFKFKSFI